MFHFGIEQLTKTKTKQQQQDGHVTGENGGWWKRDNRSDAV